jgi:hypothetical protein
MQNLKILLILFAIPLLFINLGTLQTILGNQTAPGNHTAPAITEILIPGYFNLTFDELNLHPNVLNISYVYNNTERYFLFNVTNTDFRSVSPDTDCLPAESSMGESNYLCYTLDKSLTTNPLFCDATEQDCVQPSSRHQK